LHIVFTRGIHVAPVRDGEFPDVFRACHQGQPGISRKGKRTYRPVREDSYPPTFQVRSTAAQRGRVLPCPAALPPPATHVSHQSHLETKGRTLTSMFPCTSVSIYILAKNSRANTCTSSGAISIPRGQLPIHLSRWGTTYARVPPTFPPGSTCVQIRHSVHSRPSTSTVPRVESLSTLVQATQGNQHAGFATESESPIGAPDP
jgi:hypothetical protein